MDSHRIAIITDSTCDLPPAMVEAAGLHVVPLLVIFGQEQLQDGVDITAATFYDRLKNDPVHPSTSQPSPADFVRAIEETGAEEVVCVLISSALSGTVSSALQAKEMVSIPVHVVDSMSVSVGLGFAALAAARARNAGGSVDEIIAAVRHVQETLHVAFTVETLEYLHRGGRIGTAVMLVGTALQLKPVLEVSVESGKIESIERVRSRKKSLTRIADYALEQVDATRPVHVGVMHAVSPEDAQVVLAQARSKGQVIEEMVTSVTPVVGTHGGPGVVGIAVYTD
jgi:DegV family protein with EDD domain